MLLCLNDVYLPISLVDCIILVNKNIIVINNNKIILYVSVYKSVSYIRMTNVNVELSCYFAVIVLLLSTMTFTVSVVLISISYFICNYCRQIFVVKEEIILPGRKKIFTNLVELLTIIINSNMLNF